MFERVGIIAVQHDPPDQPAVPASSPLRARNPTPRRLRAARVWTLVRVGNISIQHDLTGHKSEPVRSFRVPGFCKRGYSDWSAGAFARICVRTNATPPQREESPERRPCRFHIRLFGAAWGGRCAASTFSPSYSPRKDLQGQCGCVKAYKRGEYVLRQFRRSVRRVQRVEDSLAQVWGRAAPNVLPTESAAKPICLRKRVQRLRRQPPPPPRPRSPRPRYPVEIAIKKRPTRSEPTKADNRTTPRERTNGDLDPRNRNASYRKPSCLSPCGKQQA